MGGSFLPGYADVAQGGTVASNQLNQVNPATGNTVAQSYAVSPTNTGNRMLRLRIEASAERSSTAVVPIFASYAILNSGFTSGNASLANLTFSLTDQSVATGSVTALAASNIQVMNYLSNFLSVAGVFVFDRIVMTTDNMYNIMSNSFRTFAQGFALQEVETANYSTSEGYVPYTATGTFQNTITNLRGTTINAQVQMTLAKMAPSSYIVLEMYAQAQGFQSLVVPS